MKKVFAVLAITAFIAMVWASGCKKDTIDPGKWEPISFTIPPGWPQPYYTFATNALTYDGFALGRKLFYDTRLSRDSTISCASCHQQFSSFAQLDHDISHGVRNLLGTRNSPGLANMAWNTSYFWDGGVNNLESQPINPLQNPVEMDMTIQEAIARLSVDATYKGYFKRAFGDETINSQRIFKSLAQFMGAMVSADSKYDKIQRNTDGVSFTETESRGLTLFRQHCATCHKEPLFSDFSFRNNGLQPKAGVDDSGRAHITGLAEDKYKFKMPSLRNVAVTAPYMHDGRIATLEGVVEHYRTGVYASPTTDPLVAGGISMTDQDKADIVAFLKTLTDTAFLKNPIFAETAD